MSDYVFIEGQSLKIELFKNACHSVQRFRSASPSYRLWDRDSFLSGMAHNWSHSSLPLPFLFRQHYAQVLAFIYITFLTEVSFKACRNRNRDRVALPCTCARSQGKQTQWWEADTSLACGKPADTFSRLGFSPESSLRECKTWAFAQQDLLP